MNTMRKNTGLFLSGLILAGSFALAGCAARVQTGYRVYDVDHDDYHVWSNDEVVYYSRWENETHRKHRDYNRRSREEQHEYWQWRHSH